MGLWAAVSVAVVVSIVSESGYAVISRISPVTFKEDSVESQTCALNVTSIQDEVIKLLSLSNLTGRSAVCGGQGWTKVAVIDMSDSTNDCPDGFTTYNTPIRSCGRRHSVHITSTTFNVNQLYSSVCGRILAIQRGSPDGFSPYFNDSNPNYVFDGIGLSPGSTYSYEHLIWFFVASPSQFPTNQQSGCPCAYKEWEYSLPSYLRSNYFCQSANPSSESDTESFVDNPLWNGEGCASNSTCCQFNNPPWFFVDLKEPTTNDITMTLVLDGTGLEETLFITNVDLYVSN